MRVVQPESREVYPPDLQVVICPLSLGLDASTTSLLAGLLCCCAYDVVHRLKVRAV